MFISHGNILNESFLFSRLCDTPSGPYVTLEEALSLEDVLPPGVKGLRLGWASDKNSTIWICKYYAPLPL